MTVPIDEETPQETTVSEVNAHTQMQYMLLRLGSDMGLDIWVAKNDRNKEVSDQKFGDFPKVKAELPTQFDEATTKTIELIDVLWLKGKAIVAAFEIESTTSIYSGLLRMSDLLAMQPNITIPIYIVAPDERRAKVITEINRPTFSRLEPPLRDICSYISFSSLSEAVSKYGKVAKHMKPDFLEEIAETCEIDEE